jgi:hypothetical protein
MPFVSSTALSLVIDGDDLQAVAVTTGRRARVRASVRLGGFLDMPTELARARLAEIDPGGRVILTVPSAWCVHRPVQVSWKDWPKARDEIHASLDQLVPLDAESTSIGHIQTGASGWLLATPMQRTKPWQERISAALGRPIDSMLTTHMASLGLGFQNSQRAEFIDASSPELPPTRLAFEGGRPIALEETAEPRASVDGPGRRFVLVPGGGTPAGASTTPPGERLGPGDMAVAAAIAQRIAPGVYHPLVGSPPSTLRSLVAPVAAAVAAVACLFAAPMVYNASLDAADAENVAQIRALESSAARVEEIRAEATRMDAMLRDAVIAPTSDWSIVLPVLADVFDAVGESGYLHRLDLSGDQLAIRGEAPGATRILEQLDRSPHFENVALVAPVTPGSTRDLVIFEIRASRTQPPAGGEGAG